MEERENASTRPPRLPLPLPLPLSAHDQHDNRDRNRGRSTTRSYSSSHVSKPSASGSTLQGSRTMETLSTVSSGSSSENDHRNKGTSDKSRSLSRTSNSNAIRDVDTDARDNLGFNTITCTPQVSAGHRSRSRMGGSRRLTNANVNAPKKKIMTHSKQHLIKKKVHSRPSSTSRGRNSSQSRAGASMNSASYRSDGSSRGHSHSVAKSQSSTGRRNVEATTRARRNSRTSYSREGTKSRAKSISSSSRNSAPRARSNSRTSYSRDGTKSRANSVSSYNKISASRARSNSITSYSRDGNRSSANSVSSRGHRRRSCSKGGRSVCSGQFEVEPNVHHNAIMTTEIECPVIAEMKENELYAKKNGINFTMEGGDALEIIESRQDNMVIQDETYADAFVSSPRFKRSVPGSFLHNDDDLPSNALFLRHDEDAPDAIIGPGCTGADLAQLKLVADQLCIGWGTKEYETPTIARRIVDFQFAQMKRRKKFGNERPWGILGLYDHLAAVRMDVEWAEIVACRRANGEPYKAWFEFVGEKNTGTNRPFFTLIILCICTGFMVASVIVNDWKIEPFSTNPMIGPSAATLLKLGAKDSPLIVQGGEVWRIFSAMVLHAGFIHFFLNMLALWFVGKAIEECHGFFGTMLLFVVPSIGGTILSAIFLPNMISVGASGGIFGLIGACLADIFMNWGLLFNKVVNGKNDHGTVIVLFVLLVDIVVNSLIGLTPFIDNFTHLGGMIFGFMWGTSTMHRISTDMFESHPNRSNSIWTTIQRHFSKYFGIILTSTLMLTAFIVLMQGDGYSTPCKACSAISCVAFPPWADENSKWWYCDGCTEISADVRINSSTNEFDQLTLYCPYGDIFTLDIDDGMAGGKEKKWLENQLPKWCRSHCVGI